jgi:hypothetical protein
MTSDPKVLDRLCEKVATLSALQLQALQNAFFGGVAHTEAKEYNDRQIEIDSLIEEIVDSMSCSFDATGPGGPSKPEKTGQVKRSAPSHLPRIMKSGGRPPN